MSQEAGNDLAAAVEQDPLDAAYEDLPAELLLDDSPADEADEVIDQEPDDEEAEEIESDGDDDEEPAEAEVRDWNGNLDELPEGGVVIDGVKYDLRSKEKDRERGLQEKMRELAAERKALQALLEKSQEKPAAPEAKEPPMPNATEMSEPEFTQALIARAKWEFAQESASQGQQMEQVSKSLQQLQQEQYFAATQNAISAELAKDGDKAAEVEKVALELMGGDPVYDAMKQQGRAPEAAIYLIERARKELELKELRGGNSQKQKAAALKKADAPKRVVSRPGGKGTSKDGTAVKQSPNGPKKSLDERWDSDALAAVTAKYGDFEISK